MEERPKARLEEMFSVFVAHSKSKEDIEAAKPFCIMREKKDGKVKVPYGEIYGAYPKGCIIQVRKAKPEDFNETMLVEDVPEGIVLPEKYHWEKE